MIQTSATQQRSEQVADKNAARTKRIVSWVVAVATVVGVVTSTFPRPGAPLKRPPRSTESRSPPDTATGR